MNEALKRQPGERRLGRGCGRRLVTGGCVCPAYPHTLPLSLSLSGYAELLTASGVTIPLVCCMPRDGRAAEKRHCLLFSHGNAEDLGETLPFLTRCAESLQLPVIGFEYPGYGLARSGRQGGGSTTCAPSEQGCFEAADAAYAYVSTSPNPNPNQVREP